MTRHLPFYQPFIDESTIAVVGGKSMWSDLIDFN